MKNFTTVKARYAIYTSMIIPLLTCNCPIQSTFTKTQPDSFLFYQLTYKSNATQWVTAYIYLKPKCVNVVKNCLNKEFASDIFDNYFEMNDRSMNTESNKHCIRLPPVKLEVARCGFYFTRGTRYNSLPIDIRKINPVNIFKEKVSEFFK